MPTKANFTLKDFVSEDNDIQMETVEEHREIQKQSNVHEQSAWNRFFWFLDNYCNKVH